MGALHEFVANLMRVACHRETEALMQSNRSAMSPATPPIIACTDAARARSMSANSSTRSRMTMSGHSACNHWSTSQTI